MAVTENQSLTVLSTNASDNTAVVRYKVTCTVSGESYNNYTQTGTFNIDGTNYTNSYTLPRDSTTTVFSKDVTVGNASDRTIGASYSFPTTPSGGTKTGSTSIKVPNIPRYAKITSHSIANTGLNSITVNWSADSSCDAVQYSLNGGSWTSTSGTTYSVSGLNPNTSYRIKTRVRRANSQLWTESSEITGTTKDIAKISSVNNFNHGDSTIVKITNPSGSSLNLAMKIGNTQIQSKSVSAGNNTISFNDAELDKIYKLYGSGNSLTATFILTTAGAYTNSKTCTIILNRKSKNNKK